MIYGLIISAGNQRRFNDEIPKALMPFKSKTILDYNIENLSSFCDEVIVICSFSNEHYFDNYNHIAIDSGYGCGDAVWKALASLLETRKITKRDRCIIQWGDCLNDYSIYDILTINRKNNVLNIPSVEEFNPYVGIVDDHVYFSKYGEKISVGYHDLSCFESNINYLFEYLTVFHNKFVTENNSYIHKHNNEFQFLDVINDTKIKINLIIVEDYQPFDFNTKEEFNEKKKISWLENY